MAVLTSTGPVNLTSATNWSPSQIPVNGDDLVIGAHTLTLDADLTLDSVTFNNTASRLAISGTTRSVQATNGWNVSVALNGRLLSTILSAGVSLTLTGAWQGSIISLAWSTGGNLTLRTVGSDPSSVLFTDLAGTGVRVVSESWAGGTLSTIGRFDMPSWTGASTLVAMSGGIWSHNSAGLNSFGVGSHRIASASGTARVNWTGSVDSQSNANAGDIFTLASSSALNSIGQAGDSFVLRNATTVANGVTRLINVTSGTVVLTGIFCSTNNAITIQQSGGTITYTNQTMTLPADRYFIVDGASGTLNVSGLRLTSAKGFLIRSIGNHGITSDANTQFTCSSTAAMFAVYFNPTLESRFVVLPADPPTLPPQNKVEVGQVYGYASTPLTGTGLIVDSGVLSTSLGLALTANNIATRADVEDASVL